MPDSSILIPNPAPAAVHVMLDIETLGTSPGCVVWAIGAGAALLEQGKWQMEDEKDAFYALISVEDAGNHGLQIDPATLAWWMDPARPALAQYELRKALLGGGPERPEVLSLADALGDFALWLDNVLEPVAGEKADLCLWGNGANFDPVLIGACYAAANQTAPWDGRAVRCYRTLKTLFPEIELVRTGVYHNAKDDALCQLEHLGRLLAAVSPSPTLPAAPSSPGVRTHIISPDGRNVLSTSRSPEEHGGHYANWVQGYGDPCDAHARADSLRTAVSPSPAPLVSPSSR